MRCPVCNYEDTKVVDTRVQVGGMGIRRRRECEKCGYRFSTLEEVEIFDLSVIKRDDRREAYRREKVEAGLRRALEKRPFTSHNFKNLIGAIERDIQKKRKSEITSKEIGEVIMNRLRHFDKVAYIRFASVYRAFEDVKTFERELKKLKRGARR